MGMAELSSGETNTSIDPSRESAIWLTLISCGTATANCIRGAGRGRRATDQVAAATTAIKRATMSACTIGIRRGVATAAARTAALESVPDSALRANERSLADWKR